MHHDVKLYFLSEGVLLSLILFGKYMECTSRYEASEAIRKLIRLQPETVNVLRGSTVQTVDIRTLTPDDIVQVRSGERVPIDGAVLSGSCTVDESMLTGESEQIPKSAGARMYCGTLCREGDVTLSCAAVCEQTVLAQIIAIVAQRSRKKPPSRGWPTRLRPCSCPWSFWSQPVFSACATSCSTPEICARRSTASAPRS